MIAQGQSVQSFRHCSNIGRHKASHVGNGVAHESRKRVRDEVLNQTRAKLSIADARSRLLEQASYSVGGRRCVEARKFALNQWVPQRQGAPFAANRLESYRARDSHSAYRVRVCPNNVEVYG